MNVSVQVWRSFVDMVDAHSGHWCFENGRGGCIASYTMDHDDAAQRRVLGEQCRNAFEGGQVVVTFPSPEAA